MCNVMFFFFQAEDGIRDLVRSRGLGDVYKRQGCNMGCGASTQPDAATAQEPRSQTSAKPTAGPMTEKEEGAVEAFDSSATAVELQKTARAQVTTVIEFWDAGPSKLDLSADQVNELTQAYQNLQEVFGVHQLKVFGLFTKMANLSGGEEQCANEWKRLDMAASTCAADLSQARAAVTAVLTPEQQVGALQAVHAASENWSDIGDMCDCLNLGEHLTMLHAVPSVFEPSVAGHATADGQHRYWLKKCLVKAGVDEERIEKILVHTSQYKAEASKDRAAVEEALAAVAARADEQHELRLAALKAAVDASVKARVDLLARVYGELTSTLKCKIASSTIGRE
eukprot:TRINITY_DN3281_c0_g1_i1.p1 TRINITY_DN3281_c0_g1~~TRINITY_DN3281_c0_g1_i1.p1  ORF type:complete len:339 (-),score=92.04 TRINITY_DN3281_c0_g1_i1:244-1260(-)